MRADEKTQFNLLYLRVEDEFYTKIKLFIPSHFKSSILWYSIIRILHTVLSIKYILMVKEIQHIDLY